MAKHSSTGHGPSQRQLRIGELIRRTLSDVLLRGDIHDPDLNRHSITVGEVRMASDLKIATAYVLPLGGRDAPEALEALRRNAGEIRHYIGKEMTIKHTPQLKFQLDETFDLLEDSRRMFADPQVQADIARDDSEDHDDQPLD